MAQVILDAQDELLNFRRQTGPIPYWRDNPQAWDKPTIADKILPGTVTVQPFGPEVNIQEGRASGKDGGKVVSRGLKLAPWQVTLEIDSREDFYAWVNLAKILMPVAQPQARDLLAVSHPTLAFWGFNRGLVRHPEITPPRNGGPMIVKITILMVFERDNATHVPTNTQKGSAQVVESVPLGGEVNRLRVVTDRRPRAP